MQLRTVLSTAGAICAITSCAHATELLHITDVAMNSPAVVNLDAAGINENVYDSALLFTTSSGAVIPFFCVDIWHEVDLGPANLTYQEQALTTNSSGSLSGTGAPLTSVQIGEIGGLADVGTGLVDHGDANLAVDLAGIQAAIWSIEYPGLTVSGAADVMSRMSFYEGYAAAHPSDAFSAFYNVNGTTQGGVTGVPEPAAWCLMLLGLGAMGASLRASRRRHALSPSR